MGSFERYLKQGAIGQLPEGDKGQETPSALALYRAGYVLPPSSPENGDQQVEAQERDPGVVRTLLSFHGQMARNSIYRYWFEGYQPPETPPREPSSVERLVRSTASAAWTEAKTRTSRWAQQTAESAYSSARDRWNSMREAFQRRRSQRRGETDSDFTIEPDPVQRTSRSQPRQLSAPTGPVRPTPDTAPRDIPLLPPPGENSD